VCRTGSRAAENVGPAEALQRSGELFRETWGEQVAGGLSFGLIFTLLALPGIALPSLGKIFGTTGIVAGAVFAVLCWLLLSSVGAAVQGIFVPALYPTPRPGRSRLASAWKPSGLHGSRRVSS
jgi:xanthosine utilization system XapX-like protein